jgi:hypothetical protein
MNYRLLLIAIVALQLRALAYDESPMAPPAVDTSTGPALTIDNWVPKAAPKPKPAPAAVVPQDAAGKTAVAAVMPPAVPVITPPAVKSPAPPVSPSVAAPRAVAPAAIAPSAPPPPPKPAMNEMTGTITSIDPDAKTIRLSVEGFSPQFDFDDQTTVVSKNGKLKITDLERDDHVIVRYVGKDLIAREIERVKKAPR